MCQHPARPTQTGSVEAHEYGFRYSRTPANRGRSSENADFMLHHIPRGFLRHYFSGLRGGKHRRDLDNDRRGSVFAGLDY